MNLLRKLFRGKINGHREERLKEIADRQEEHRRLSERLDRLSEQYASWAQAMDRRQ